ncbi:similar to Saccharomyces cerevisiae YOR081C TGL5 Bifunctional enzyme with triacylglycerol lipase and lysophosphatidic acid acyltransferase activity [Maudiozyma saulgeensis]|uniref:Similar to Saccharomyces cerevisiae YOR081C TGL5 Bifunctional enzyme with triacylglycerol lipase and lysophosphatidic acid acyltransferase activity n=1 Tax=Maudiozyma saulgeensis TaxID=1789683 RepID=A0A1X7R9G4_9SACH|nr:similar to Saccharomyces cerevisiae YOR081C TGL5 Bifunctional enzyme with triacylglycerol lipase and lysophosphatidic acid acyltransferase activity [Kazachstania saulgeensis]
MNNNDRHSATQALIQKYYDYMLGLPTPTTTAAANNTINGEETEEEKDQIRDDDIDNSLLRQRFISNLIRHTRSRHTTALDETDAETDTERGIISKYNKTNSGNIVKINVRDDSVNDDVDSDEESNLSLLDKMKNVLYAIFVGDYEKDVLIERVSLQKKHAMTFDDWRKAALELDTLTNKTDWKKKKDSTLYDYQLIEDVTLKLRESRINKDYAQLLYIIRTNWVRNLGNMGNVNLYRHSYVGTKYLIDDYIEESKLSLNALVTESDLDDRYLMGILQQTRRNIGRTALVLSGGGTFGMFHIGLLATLFELDLLPRVISGSSAGAIVASILTVHHKEEIPALLDHILDMEFNIFKDDDEKSESENFLIKFQRFFKNGTWFDNKHLINTMIQFLGDLTFREAYNRTGKILNITVSPDTLFEQPRLLNNLTAPNVLIWSAVCASCSLPGIFPSSPLYEKDPKTGKQKPWSGSSSVKFVDGSVDNDLPISRLSEMFNVDHIIACQVNIHVFPFLKLSLSCVGGEIEDEFSARLKRNLTKMYNFMADEMIHLFEIGCEMGIAKNTLTRLRSVLSQQYSGDITILPEMNALLRFKQLLSNPTKEFLLREITNGARATWRKISIIQNHCGQEFALEKAISHLRGRIIVSSSIRNPLQFNDTPIGLIKAAQKYHTRERKQKMLEFPTGNLDEIIVDNEDMPIGKGQDESSTEQNSKESSKSVAIDSDEKNSTPIGGVNSDLDDDNLVDTESTNSLLVLKDNEKKEQYNTDLKDEYMGNKNNIHLRRKSDTGSRPRNGKSLSFSIASPSTRSLRTPTRRTNSSYKDHTHKASTGHIFPPILQKTDTTDYERINTDLINVPDDRPLTLTPSETTPAIEELLNESDTTPTISPNMFVNKEKDTFYIDSDTEDREDLANYSIASDNKLSYGYDKNNLKSARRYSEDDRIKNIKMSPGKTSTMFRQSSLGVRRSSTESPKALRTQPRSCSVRNIDVDDGISPLANESSDKEGHIC